MEDEMDDGPAARLAMILLRSDLGWDQTDLAREARIQRSQVSDYERGEETIPWKNLYKTADATEFPRHLLESALRTLRSFRALRRGWSRPLRALGDRFMAELVAFVHEAVEELLPAEAPEAGEDRAPAAGDRLQVPGLWARLVHYTRAQQDALLEELAEFRSWALCEKAAAESLAAAADDPRRAFGLADLALKIADWVAGPETWRWRLQGYVWAHLAKVREACADLSGAADAMTLARKLWEAGAPGDPGLLDAAWDALHCRTGGGDSPPHV
jgi:transcriptional regulator with XRE-family HTH domain